MIADRLRNRRASWKLPRLATPGGGQSAYPALKRAIDVGAAGAGLAALSPLFGALAVAVKLDSPGPVFYGHGRVGRYGDPIKVWKFRTMVPDADKRGAAITAGGDPRITRVGRLLRNTKLDELPQLWNVVRGDLSLVGPRPEVARYVEMFPEDYRRILQVRPGITDEAAIEFRDEESILAAADDPEQAYVEQVLPAKIALYHRYVENASLTYDLALVVRTLIALAQRD